MPQFIVKCLGCKVNQCEAGAFAAVLRHAGLRAGGQADLCVVHTCCVTAEAGRKARQLIRRLAARNPGARIVVTGCAATADPQALRALPGVTDVVGHEGDPLSVLAEAARFVMRGKPVVARRLSSRESAKQGGLTHAGDRPASVLQRTLPTYSKPSCHATVKDNHPGPALRPRVPGRDGERCRALVKVQDGCDAFCAYCIVPHLRRRLVTRPLADVIDEIHRLVDAGYAEVVLCGINLAAYGTDTAPTGRSGETAKLLELIARVCQVDGLKRVRLSSLSPLAVTEELARLMHENSNLCPHLHLSLQSGSDAILARMGRRYTAERFLQAVDTVRKRIDRPAITTDIIVGFPGESEKDFEATKATASAAGFAKVHVFPFSARPGTAAAAWQAEVPPAQVIKARCDELTRIADQLAREYRSAFVGQDVAMLVERISVRGVYSGLTDRYLRLASAAPPGDRSAERVGRVVGVRVDSLSEEGLLGTLLEDRCDRQGR